MLVKIYWTIWLAVATVAAIIFVSGSMTLVAVVAFGFIAFGLTFMGLMGVLPATISHPTPAKTKVEKRTERGMSERGHARQTVTSAHVQHSPGH